MSTHKPAPIKDGTKVRPVNGHGEPMETKAGISYGYVRGPLFVENGRLCAEVYWPEIKARGTWPAEYLKSCKQPTR